MKNQQEMNFHCSCRYPMISLFLALFQLFWMAKMAPSWMQAFSKEASLYSYGPSVMASVAPPSSSDNMQQSEVLSFLFPDLHPPKITNESLEICVTPALTQNTNLLSGCTLTHALLYKSQTSSLLTNTLLSVTPPNLTIRLLLIGCIVNPKAASGKLASLYHLFYRRVYLQTQAVADLVLKRLDSELIPPATQICYWWQQAPKLDRGNCIGDISLRARVFQSSLQTELRDLRSWGCSPPMRQTQPAGATTVECPSGMVKLILRSSLQNPASMESSEALNPFLLPSLKYHSAHLCELKQPILLTFIGVEQLVYLTCESLV